MLLDSSENGKEVLVGSILSLAGHANQKHVS
jgi:hypothetical protein